MRASVSMPATGEVIGPSPLILMYKTLPRIGLHAAAIAVHPENMSSILGELRDFLAAIFACGVFFLVGHDELLRFCSLFSRACFANELQVERKYCGYNQIKYVHIHYLVYVYYLRT